MQGISDIHIAGIDEKRPPRIRKEPYIDLYFRLSHKAPADWCKRFNDLLAKHRATPKIDLAEGLFIQTWVRMPDEIDEHLKLLKSKVAECTDQYIARVEEARKSAAAAAVTESEDMGEQARLNRIVAGLEFDEPETAVEA